MKPPLIKSLVGCLFLIFLTGCEYNLKKENFRDIAKPSETIQFDLRLFPEMDTIGVYSETDFTYGLLTQGLELKSTTITIDDKPAWLLSDNKTIRVAPGNFTDGYHILSIVMITNSGSGSIADLTGSEGYLLEKKWVLYTCQNQTIKLNQTITREGYLKVTWPNLKIPEFKNYQISFWCNNTSIEKTISQIDNTCYIDSNYVGGSASLQVLCQFNFKNPSSISGYLNLNDSFPQLKFEDLSADSLRISWKKSNYRAMYKLEKSNITPGGILLDSKTDTSVVIAQDFIGNTANYSLYIAPRYLTTTSWNILCDTRHYCMGTRVAVNWPDFGYNASDCVFYTNSYDDVECYDAKTLQKISSYRIKDLMYTTSFSRIYSGASNSTKLGVLSPDSIFIFSDKTLTGKVTIPYNARNKKIDYFYLTDNGIVALTSPGKYELISVAGKNVLATLPIDDYPVYSAWASFSTSKDGKYFCVVTRNGIKTYANEGGTFTLLYSGSEVYRSALFSIENPDQLYLTSNTTNVMEIRHMPDFSLMRSISLPTERQVLRNIDPLTGHLFTTDYYDAFVIDMQTNKVLFKSKVGDIEYRPLLFDNLILTIYGYAVNITKFLK